jgi:hypothetical protein
MDFIGEVGAAILKDGVVKKVLEEEKNSEI